MCFSFMAAVLLQSRDVVVYRLVTCGTVEEKIYRKQVRTADSQDAHYGIITCTPVCGFVPRCLRSSLAAMNTVKSPVQTSHQRVLHHCILLQQGALASYKVPHMLMLLRLQVFKGGLSRAGMEEGIHLR
jgi:hypothetical protein